ncbi:MAG TPA: capsule assembly Wzi family protein, partial [Pedobacter sp.]|nr:capsule assembly Wzi family protein [Pedobacter sp.]
QIIGGKLENTGITGQYLGNRPKLNDWRYLSGINLNYQPKWISGLYLGLQRSFIVYQSQMGNGFGDYFPFFTSVTKNSFSVEDGGADKEDLKQRDQIISLSARWLLQDAKAEIYVEYGREDHSKDLRDFVVEPEHDRAYVFGFRKLFDIGVIEGQIQAGIEFTHFENSISSVVRAPVIWYAHTQVRDGYTNKGQLLGAGISPGSNAQTFDLNWVNAWDRIGFRVERITHNNVLYDREFVRNKGDKREWSDIAFTGRYDKELGRFIFNSQFTYVKSTNYQWVVRESNEGSPKNIQMRLGIMYRW